MGHHGPTFDPNIDRRLTGVAEKVQKPLLIIAAACIALATVMAFVFAETKRDKNYNPTHATETEMAIVEEVAKKEGKEPAEFAGVPMVEIAELSKESPDDALGKQWEELFSKTYGWQRFQASYLTAFVFVMSVSLGALFFVIIQHLTRAGWSVVVRRIAEIMAGSLGPLAILSLPVLIPLMFSDHSLFEWNHPEKWDSSSAIYDELLEHKSPWLNPTFFLFRCAIYFGIWAWLGKWYLKKSVTQDVTGDPQLTLDSQIRAPVATFMFAFSVNFFAFDFMMSLAPHWFSTIYGIYFFAGCVVSGLASMILITSYLKKQGVIKEEVTVEHFHDLAKLQFGFTFFWGYIAFSQFILIWYANIPEETFWYLIRMENGWEWLSLVLLFGHLLIPFLGLMSRASRRTHKILLFWATWMLVMHAFDIYWNIIPQFSTSPGFHLGDLLMIIGMGALALWFYIRTAVKMNVSMVPVRDPRMSESLAFHNM